MIDLVQNENTFFCYTAIYRVNFIIHSIVEMDLNDHQYTATQAWFGLWSESG